MTQSFVQLIKTCCKSQENTTTLSQKNFGLSPPWRLSKHSISNSFLETVVTTYPAMMVWLDRNQPGKYKRGMMRLIGWMRKLKCISFVLTLTLATLISYFLRVIWSTFKGKTTINGNNHNKKRNSS